MFLRPAVVALSFVLPGLGLLYQGLTPQAWPHRLLALAMLLLLIEQAHMARVDGHRAAQVAARYPNQARRFQNVLGVTIAVEWLGFALAAAGFLGLGASVVVIALLGFNLASNISFAGDRLWLAGPRDRWGVILADCVGLGLMGLWQLPLAQPWVGSGALGLMGLYWAIKAWNTLAARRQLSSAVQASAVRASTIQASAIQVAHAAQQHPQPRHQNS